MSDVRQFDKEQLLLTCSLFRHYNKCATWLIQWYSCLPLTSSTNQWTAFSVFTEVKLLKSAAVSDNSGSNMVSYQSLLKSQLSVQTASK